MHSEDSLAAPSPGPRRRRRPAQALSCSSTRSRACSATPDGTAVTDLDSKGLGRLQRVVDPREVWASASPGRAVAARNETKGSSRKPRIRPTRLLFQVEVTTETWL
jgi:hypothetical protein